MRVEQAPSPGCGPRRGDARPDLVVIHHTGMATAAAALDRLRDPGSEVSAHYLIAEDGMVWRLVAEDRRAWHAGAGAWGAVTDVNSRSIGIELANPGPLAGLPPFAAPQMAALECLLADILARWAIPPERVIGHSDMAPGRKSDPGPKFDWRRLARAGLSVWPEPGGRPGDFWTHSHRFGYRVAAAPGSADALLAAFRMRFRPGATGPVDDTDRALIADLAARYPVAA
jgi:N-acetylmuramoyl-L-alanine amidase